MRAFPPRARETSWPLTEAAYDKVLDQLQRPPLRPKYESTQNQRLVGARLILGWLGTFPGASWQERWEASPASDAYKGWHEQLFTWARSHGRVPAKTSIGSGMLALISADALRPSLSWIAANPTNRLRPAMASSRDPEGFKRLLVGIPEPEQKAYLGSAALKSIAQIMAAHGGGVDEITVGDLLALFEVKAARKGQTGSVRLAYTWLRNRGQFPVNAPTTLHNLASRAGQVGPYALVDRHRIQCRPVRNLLVDYLTERQPAVDYITLRLLADQLAGLFWADLERHHPGIDNLRLAPEVSEAWKARITQKTVPNLRQDGKTEEIAVPRKSAASVKLNVRAFYLDIAQWALDEPERWGLWAAPSPVSEADCVAKKIEREQKARADQRTRERLPVLPALVRTAGRRLKEAKVRLDAILAAPLGSTVTVLGDTFTLSLTTTRADGKPTRVRDASGARRDLRSEEKQAFFTWATIEILRHTGIRIEELLELSHHSIIRYTLPSTGEVVPLLQIAPSKIDKERLILINPELADVLSALVSRVRRPDGRIASIRVYDAYEKIWKDPMPVLYQWTSSGEIRGIAMNTVRRGLNDTLRASGILDADGNPLLFQPHDFRRIFITDAILHGLPPHIAQVIAGHDKIDTTMGYAAIYPADAIEAHRAFIARRRSVRPAEEYRAVSPEEWDEFLGHFQRRKLALGECGRAYGTDCAHEHACVRCPVLIVGPDELPRLEEIRDNLCARIAEAEQEGWLGDVEQLSVSLAAANEKIGQLNARQEKLKTPTFLGIPQLGQIAGRGIGD